MKFKCLFSYYGSKSKLAHHYPAPKHDVLVEPFAGGASYSLLHHERQVVLNELDPTTASIWHYFLTTDLNTILASIPDSPPAGKRVSDMVDIATSDPGLVGMLRAEANHGTAGGRAVWDVVTPMAARCWSRLKPRIEYWWPKTRHWSLIHGDYLFLPQQKATWFVDPPYFNKAGAKYKQSDVDYHALGWWCRTRRGQVVVCENDGAAWLPFQPLVRALGVGGKNRALEVIWTKED